MRDATHTHTQTNKQLCNNSSRIRSKKCRYFTIIYWNADNNLPCLIAFFRSKLLNQDQSLRLFGAIRHFFSSAPSLIFQKHSEFSLMCLFFPACKIPFILKRVFSTHFGCAALSIKFRMCVQSECAHISRLLQGKRKRKFLKLLLMAMRVVVVLLWLFICVCNFIAFFVCVKQPPPPRSYEVEFW